MTTPLKDFSVNFRPLRHEKRSGVGQLDLAPFSRFGHFQPFKDLRRVNVTRRHRQIAGSLFNRGFFHKLADFQHAGLLLTENPENLLPTVRSRCTELSLQALPPQLLKSRLQQEFPDADELTLSAAMERSGGYLGQAIRLLRDGVAASPQTQGFVDSFARRDPVALVQTLVPMERWKRDQLLSELERWTQVLQQAVICRSGVQVLSPMARRLGSMRSSQDLMQAIRKLQKCTEYLQGNVSAAAVCGYLEWALR